VLEEERREMRQAILDRLSPGDIVEGTISNIVDFGAFVDLEGIDGLIHISELSWSHVNHPSELLEIGQEVRVKVLDIDRERQRISLGLKQTQSDPWQQVIDTYQQGDVVEGRVTKVVTFGAFVEVIPGVEGLVHISELAPHHVENPREVVQQGETLRAKIIEMDAERRRLSLSLKRVEEGESPRPGIGEDAPELGLSDEVFTEQSVAEPEAPAEESEAGPSAEPEEAVEPEGAAPPAAEEEPVEPEGAAPPVAEEEPVEPEGAAPPVTEEEPEAQAEEPEAPAEDPEAAPAVESEAAPAVEPEGAAPPAAEEEPVADEAAAPEGEASAEPEDREP
jgi:small subunit ribosomal protein S1